MFWNIRIFGSLEIGKEKHSKYTWICSTLQNPEVVFNIMPKCELAKTIDLKMWFFCHLPEIFLPFELLPATVISYPFDKFRRQKMAKNISAIEWQQKLHLQMDIFCHFKFCQNKKNILASCTVYYTGGLLYRTYLVLLYNRPSSSWHVYKG